MRVSLRTRRSTRALIILPLEILVARHGLTVPRSVSFSLTLLIALIAMSKVLVFSQSESLATLSAEEPAPVKVENSSSDDR